MFDDPLVYLLVTILVPIVPAFIFFKWLPSEANVSGPWKGLRIKLTGAFGGYFLIFATLILLLKSKIVTPQTPLWTVVGQISADSHLTRDNQITCDTDPPAGHVDAGNGYRVLFRKDDQGDFPDLLLTAKPDGLFQPLVIHLDPKWQQLPQAIKFSRDAIHHVITVDPVTLVKIGDVPYNPTAQPSSIPTPTPTPITSKNGGS
jgi:hypothetical protein